MEPSADDDRSGERSLGALETLLVQDVVMTAFAATVSHLIRQPLGMFGGPVPINRWILLEICLWGGGLGLLFTALSLGLAHLTGLTIVPLFGTPPLATAVGVALGSTVVAALFAPVVVPIVFG